MSLARPALSGTSAELPTVGLVGLAHFTSHFLMFALVPLLPLIRDEFDVTFTALGLALTVFFAVSGIGQIVAGILVDRFGPHRLLLGGMAIQALSVLLMGIAPVFWLLFPLNLLAGAGNGVYHPTDLSILSRRVGRGRQGRAFAWHLIAGGIGFAASPVLVGLAATEWGWRAALVGAGLFGLVIVGAMLVNRGWLKADEFHPDAQTESERNGGPAERLSFAGILRLPVVRFGLGFFFLSTLSFHGIITFSVSAFTEGYGLTLALATVLVAATQAGVIAGTLAGGVIADRYGHHHRVAVLGTVAAALLMLPLLHTGMPWPAMLAFLVLVGTFFGATLPSRDVLIRQAAPRGNLGKTFGAVYSGLDAGALAGPLLIGPMLDAGAPQLLFALGAAAMLLATLTVTRIPLAGPAAAARSVG